MDAAEIERRVVARLRDVSFMSPHLAARSNRLFEEFGCAGAEFCRLGELIEEEFGITVTPSHLINIALFDPTVGGVCDLVDEALADA